MTTVTVFSREPGELGLRVQGHSGSAPYGEDLVCAAASILAWTLVEATQEEPGYNALFMANEEQTIIEVSCCPDEEKQDACRVLYDTILTGYQLLAEREPEHIEIRSENDGYEHQTDNPEH